MRVSSTFAVVATFATAAFGHAVVTAPTPRTSGSAQVAACGAAVSKVLNSDKTGPIENAVAKIDGDYNAAACHLFQCRGYQFSDNTGKVQKFSAGQVVNFKVDLEAHHTGYANVSVINLATDKTVGNRLYNWPVYANSSLGPSQWPKNETDFNITIPSSLGSQCATAGSCAIQWFWYATENSQTYESCVDFTV